jgi:hypothetical protein
MDKSKADMVGKDTETLVASFHEQEFFLDIRNSTMFASLKFAAADKVTPFHRFISQRAHLVGCLVGWFNL